MFQSAPGGEAGRNDLVVTVWQDVGCNPNPAKRRVRAGGTARVWGEPRRERGSHHPTPPQRIVPVFRQIRKGIGGGNRRTGGRGRVDWRELRPRRRTRLVAGPARRGVTWRLSDDAPDRLVG